MHLFKKIKNYIYRWGEFNSDDLSLWIASAIFFGVVGALFPLLVKHKSENLFVTMPLSFLCGIFFAVSGFGPIVFGLLCRICVLVFRDIKNFLIASLLVSNVFMYSHFNNKEKNLQSTINKEINTETKSTDTKEEELMVYICPTSSSYAYHRTKNCGALRSCSLNYKKISLSKAEEIGRRPCQRCY